MDANQNPLSVRLPEQDQAAGSAWLLDEARAIDSLLLQAEAQVRCDEFSTTMRMALHDMTTTSQAVLLAALLNHPSSEVREELGRLHYKITLAPERSTGNPRGCSGVKACLCQAKLRLQVLGRSRSPGPRHD